MLYRGPFSPFAPSRMISRTAPRCRCSTRPLWHIYIYTYLCMVPLSGITVPPNGMVPLDAGPRHNVLRYYTVLYYTIPYYTIPYHTIPYHTIPYHTMLCYAIQVQRPFHHHSLVGGDHQPWAIYIYIRIYKSISIVFYVYTYIHYLTYLSI